MRRYTHLNRNQVIDLYCGRELSAEDVARKLNVSRPVIQRILQEEGIELRRAYERIARAHEARRGQIEDEQTLVHRAKRRERIPEPHISRHERQFARWLRARNLAFHRQTAIGPYNCDFTSGGVAMEIFGGGWHWTDPEHLARLQRRIPCILNAGWHLLIIPANVNSPLTPAVADWVVAYIRRSRRKPSASREYRVVWRAGEYMTSGGADDDHFSIAPPFTMTRDPRTGRFRHTPL